MVAFSAPTPNEDRTLSGRRCPTCDRPLARYQQCLPCRRPMAQRDRPAFRHARPLRAKPTRQRTRLGIPIEEYRARVEAGEAWCGGHKTWHPSEAFGAGWGCKKYHRDYQRNLRAVQQEANRAQPKA